MMNYGKIVTKEMVYERACLLITSLEADLDLSELQVDFYEKKLELAYALLKKLLSDKVPPALILAQLNKHFGTSITNRTIDIKLIKEAKSRIINPINLN